MPITRSAKRALKKSLRRRYINNERRRKIKIAVKKFLNFVKEKNKEEAKKALQEIYKQLDKAAKRFLHTNKANRLKSKYAKLLLAIK